MPERDGILRTGDTVLWRGAWGDWPEKPATITQIDLIGEHNLVVEEIPWASVTGRNLTVSLDNGHWAWAFQIRPLAAEKEQVA